MPFIQYCFVSVSNDDFSESVSKLFNNISEKEKVLTISVFGEVTENEYFLKAEIIRKTALEIMGQLPLVCFIAQSPQDKKSLIAEVGYLADSISMSCVTYHESPVGRFLTINTPKFSTLLLEGIMADNMLEAIGKQSISIFNKIKQMLELVSMPVENIVRQWNYIGNITAIENNRQNYQEFNNARTDFYGAVKWKKGFPAATGISMSIRKVMVSLIAIQFHDNSTVYPLNNSHQLAAHFYSAKMLGESDCKHTPKFERAKIIDSGSSTCCFISGTAAIKGEESKNSGDIEGQTLRTISLIRHLISRENLKENGIDVEGKLKMAHLRVYVKQPEDFEKVREVVETELPGISAFYVCAGICRDELLVEIEGIATT